VAREIAVTPTEASLLARWLAVAVLGTVLTGCGTFSGALRADSRPAAPSVALEMPVAADTPASTTIPVLDPTAGQSDAVEPAAVGADTPSARSDVAADVTSAPAEPGAAPAPQAAGPSPADAWMAQARDTDEDIDAVENEYDPWEKFNEKTFEFNRRLDKYVLKPVAKAYNFITPDELQIMISNAFDNISFPPRLVNSVLQGKLKGAGRELARFLINSTAGVGGLFDPAKDVFGLTKSREDFGQTLGFYGVGPGPYLIVPFMEPLTVRDGIGKAVDGAMDPLAYYLPLFWDRLGMKIGDIVNERSLNLDLFQGFEESVIDLYSAVRHGYLQRREKLIRE
jgi:phospholipid-binding lipoprotein MlaA